MDILLGKVTQQAMNYAIRSGITITAGYAIRQSTRLLKTVEGNEKEELQELQERLNNKIRIISPAIDMIELISARGNTSLESAVSLTKSLRWEIQNLGQRLAAAANAEELVQRGSSKPQDKSKNQAELKRIIVAIRKLLDRIEDAVPLINLAITASGASLSSTLPSTVSPSRLLQASTFLTAGDAQYGIPPFRPVQIGPSFTLSLYMLFIGHVRPQNEDDIRDSTWKEVIHKAQVKLMRVPINAIYKLPGNQMPAFDGPMKSGHRAPDEIDSDYFPPQIEGEGKADEYAYQLVIIEDLDDDRVHSFDDSEEQPGPCEEVSLAGIRETIPIHEISKIFYADTGKILNIGSDGETNNPILLLKRDINAVPPRRMMERYHEEDPPQVDSRSNSRRGETPAANGDHESVSQLSLSQHESRPVSPTAQTSALTTLTNPWRFPPDLDPEWVAFEVYTESSDSEAESETDMSTTRVSRKPSSTPSLDTQATAALSRLQLADSSPSSTPHRQPSSNQIYSPSLPAIQTSLSLLETILRLLSLQQFQQLPHLSIPDELLTFFLSESASTGSDGEDRKRMRNEARRRVGFDPYDESPVKRRGEEYQYQRQNGDDWAEGGNSYGDYGEEYATPGAAYDGYGSPIRYDEGYETHPWSRSPGPRAPSTPRTPPLLLKNQSQSPRSSASRSGTPLRWAGQKALGGDREAARRGSPLARPGTGVTDEGLGTSPASGGEVDNEEKKP